MRIGILTFHNANNYGAVLQAYCLQETLRRIGFDVEIVDYRNPLIESRMHPFSFSEFLYHPFLFVFRVLRFFPSYKHRATNFNKFRTEFLVLSKRYTAINLRTAPYNYFIIGSDQVWNIRCMDADDAYYLNFVSDFNRRYAYAVSFGANNPFADSSLKDHYLNLVNKFNKISVREQNAKKWVSTATGREVSLCVDPTMLLSQGEWEKTVQLGSAPIIQGDYIFYYCFSISQEIASFLHQVSKKTGMPVYFFEPKEWALRCCWKNKIRLVKKYGPEAFLNYMKYAKMVFTTSFHGTAFSTIFHKNFWYIDSGHNDLSKDDRAVSFLTQLKLTDRYKTISSLLQTDLSLIPDYTQPDQALAKLREECFLNILKA
mgnify:CR=1 FL=1